MIIAQQSAERGIASYLTDPSTRGNRLLEKILERENMHRALIPYQLRELVWKNQRTFYSLMFATVQDVLKTFTQNDKKLGGNGRVHNHPAHPFKKP